MLTNPRDAFRGQSRSPNSSIPYVRYSCLLCNSKFVFVFFLRYSPSVILWPWNLGQSAFYNPVQRRFTTSARKWQLTGIDCSTAAQGHHSIERICLLLTFCSNYGSVSFPFWDIQCRKVSWPWNLGQRWLGNSRSLKVVPFGRLYMVSY